MKSIWPPLMAASLTLLAWFFVGAAGWIPEYLLPGPQQVLAALVDRREEFQSALFTTAQSTLWGFLASAVSGYLLALAFVLFPLLKRAFLPFAVFFQTVPVITLAPLLVIWFGFGEPTVRASAFIVSFFPVLANSLIGLGNVSQADLELFEAYKASRLQVLRCLLIPSSLLSLLSGLQISAGLAVIGSLVGEFVAGGGIGGLIDSARTQQRVDVVFAAILLVSLLGAVFVSAVRFLGRSLLKWKPFFPPEAI